MLKLFVCLSLFVTLTYAGIFTPTFYGSTFAIRPVPQFAVADIIVFEEPLYMYDVNAISQPWYLYQQNQPWGLSQQNTFALQNFQPGNPFQVPRTVVPNQPVVNTNPVTPGFQVPNPPITNIPTDNTGGSNVVPSPVDMRSH